MRATLAWIGDRLPPSLYFLLAGNSAPFLNGETDMIEINGPLARLRKAFRSLEDLPEVIPAAWRPGDTTTRRPSTTTFRPTTAPTSAASANSTNATLANRSGGTRESTNTLALT